MTAPVALALALSPTWLRGCAWRRPDSRVEEMFSLPFHRDVALAAEGAGVGALFLPDALSLRTDALAESPGFSMLDSMVLMSALAAVTTTARLIPTVSARFHPPYLVARQLRSLQAVSGGRAGWNVVTSLGGAENFGVDRLEGTDPYARADAFVRLVEDLWASYPAAALIRDRQAGRFADPDLIHPLDHDDAFFSVAGPLGVPGEGDDPFPLFTAGASDAARAFAGRHADGLFAVAAEEEQARSQRDGLRAAARTAGRDADAVRFLPGLHLVLARTRLEAQALVEASDPAGPPHWRVVGTPEDALRAIERRVAAGGADGFVALPGGSVGSLELFCERVLPRLEVRAWHPRSRR